MQVINVDKYPFTAEYKALIEPETIEEVDRLNPNVYEEGFSLFNYNEVKRNRYLDKPIPELEVEKETVLIKTRADINFRKGDLVRLENNNQYVIKSIEYVVDKKYQKQIRLFPNLRERYTDKVLELV